MSIIEQYENHIYKLIINRPKRGNSLDLPTLIDLRQKIIDAQSNDEIKVIALTGFGEKDFTTGIDLKSAMELSDEDKVKLVNVAGDIATLIYHGKITVVALNGRTMGMGVVFAIAADYRIGLDNITIQMPEINSSIFPGANCTTIMIRVCGLKWTRKLLFFGEAISAKEGIDANIIDDLVPSIEKLNSEFYKKSCNLINKDNSTLNKIKLAINNSFDLKFYDMTKLESDLLNIKLELEHIKKKYNLELKLSEKLETD